MQHQVEEVATVAGSGVDGGEVGIESELEPLVGCLIAGGAAASESSGFFFGSFPAVLMNKPGMVHTSELVLQFKI